MRQYAIENKILFSPTETTFVNVETQEQVSLSLLASDIFSSLIDHHGSVVDREALFDGLFERHGAAPTNNNLNQYILNLRKQLKLLGLETEIIQTVPRIGFMIPPGVLIEPVSDVSSPTREAPPLLADAEPPTTAPAPLRKRRLLAAFWTALMILVTLSALFYQWLSEETGVSWESQLPVNAIALNDDKMCQILLIPSGMASSKASLKEYRTAINEITPIECGQDVRTRYYLYQSAEGDAYTRSFVLRCTQKGNERPGCYSWYKGREK